MIYQGTNIDGPSLTPEQLNIRGKNLTDLIKECSYLEVVHHIITGDIPSKEELQQLDAFCNQALFSVANNAQAITLLNAQALLSSDSVKTIIQGLLIGFEREFEVLFPTSKIAYDKDTAYGIFLMSATPLFAYISLQETAQPTPEILTSIIDEDRPFIENVFALFFGRSNASAHEILLFESLLIAWHAGFGHLTPSVMGPRVAAGTFAPMNLILMTGYTCSGPFHIGASQFALDFLLKIGADGYQHIEDKIQKRLDTNERIPGFGHPLFKKDPRNDVLQEIWNTATTDKKHIDAYIAICQKIKTAKKISPNIDFITAGILCELGASQPTLAPSVALFSRASAILAHAKEKKEKPPFGSKSTDARKHLDQLSMEWI